MIILILALFSLGSLGRISFFNQEINIYLYEVIYAAYVLFLASKYGDAPFRKYFERFKTVYWFISALIITFAFSLPRFEPFQNLVAFLYLGRLLLYLTGLPLVVHHVAQHERRRELEWGIGVYLILTAVFSLIQFIYYPNLRNLEYLGWDPHHYRMFGTVFDTSTAAALYGLSIIIIWFSRHKMISSRTIWVSSLIGYIVLSLATYARGFYIAIAATVLHYFIVMKRQIMAGIFVLILAAGFVLILPKPAGESTNLARVFTIQSRIADYQTGWKIFASDPITGVGYNHLRYVKPSQNNDTANHAASSLSSSFLIVLATMGIVGMLAFISLLLGLARTSTAAAYAIMFLSVYSLFDNILLHPLVLFLLTCLIALYSDHEVSQKTHKKQRS